MQVQLFILLVLANLCILINGIPPIIGPSSHKFDNDCPLECECEKRISTNKEEHISVFCLNGNLSNTDFYSILKTIPISVTSLEIEAPLDKSNYFQWSDNLNRFRYLKKLSLINCQIPAISQSVQLSKLEHLSLKGNAIKHLSVHSFSGMRNLRHLDLSFNQIGNLPTGAFNFLRQLNGLSLAHNQIKDLATNLLKGPYSLKSLQLDGNSIKLDDLNRLLVDVPDLERLELNYCLLDDNSVSKIKVKQINKLLRLGIAGNNLTHVPSTMFWKQLPRLLEVDLSYNEIETIEPCAFCGANISRIFLGANLLGAKRDTLHPEAFADTQLTELDLSDNLMTKFNSNSLGYAQHSLKTLHLSDNDLTNMLPQLIHTLPRLTHLHLADNGIRQIPETLSNEYSQLTFLNLSGNWLAQLPDNVHNLLPSMNSIDISRNRFTKISTSVLSNFLNDMNQVYLYDNPWDCRCAISNIQQFMLQRQSYRIQLRYSQTQCQQPEIVKGLPVHTAIHINDCGIFLGAKYGFNEMNEIGLLFFVILIFTCFLSLIILVCYYNRDARHKGTYLTKEGTHSILSRSVNSTIMTRTPTPEKGSYKGFENMLIPPPPPPPGSIYMQGY
uniref:LRRCT domain-containing protein n=1 Tax=Rhabditophanes sp. KR3021 TaxID=114890 RepID=A0AC35U920_9BILA